MFSLGFSGNREDGRRRCRERRVISVINYILIVVFNFVSGLKKFLFGILLRF